MAAIASSLYVGYENPEEVNYICAVENLASILERGVLSHKRAHRLEDVADISNQEVQDRRARVLPANPDRSEQQKQSLSLHRYVNLYLQPYNRTLYQFYQEKGGQICILRLHKKLLEREESLIATRNAATNAAEFYRSRDFTFDPDSSKILHLKESKLAKWYLEKQGVAVDANSADQIRQAELLVPYKIPPNYIKGIYVPNQNVKNLVDPIFGRPEKVTIHPSLFFQDGKKWHSLDDIVSPILSDSDVDSYDATSSEEV